MLPSKQIQSDHCPDCGQLFEIRAVELHLFRKPAILFVCPSCGLARADGDDNKVNTGIRDRIAALDRRLWIATSRCAD
jgi:predicted RNA-binding Zn-ribbon protein involved in translation (DUF1610 family)